MKNRDYLWCALHMMLDDQELLDRMCPACRTQALEDRCPVCGLRLADAEGSRNAAFDEARFAALSRGELP
ncbi:molybdopterin oxidoreductase [Pseudoflavonifractor phocaeensis]|uniref:molybdopterin oxidoreductase n=1 Tax=Pseudoflavonifractor phocaeensis TaxID=1870988 RepID=UPI0019589AB6|nr:molybdopterin oxidoreductase [Pseudoflavonifractor phocaeensis]MBM6938694.1 molybdopterin oxidoreductase [Pseudoflavonifractor phocaeensis]